VRRSVILAAVVALLAAPSAHAGRGLMLGFDDDTLKWQHRPNGVVGVDRELGVRTIRITIPWRRGLMRPRFVAQRYLSRASRALVLGQRIVIAVYGRAADAPVDARSRRQYCHYVHYILWRIPQITDVVVWNEANSPMWWPTRAGPAAYERLLADCWDVLHKRLRHPVNVIDSTASRHDPLAFIAGLGEAYRNSGRTLPIVDVFGHNPYPENASEPPWTMHPDGTDVGEGDYASLLRAISEAFLFTGQPVPSVDRPTLWYLEDGFQTLVPASLEHLYTGRETDPFAVPPVAPGAANQADQLRAAVGLAYCQPAVGAFFNFELFDERRLAGWQSGLMYTNGVPKPSFLAFRDVSRQVHAHTIDCAKVAGAPAQPEPAKSP
jgi:hypothetical protein